MNDLDKMLANQALIMRALGELKDISPGMKAELKDQAEKSEGYARRNDRH